MLAAVEKRIVGLETALATRDAKIATLETEIAALAGDAGGAPLTAEQIEKKRIKAEKKAAKGKGKPEKVKDPNRWAKQDSTKEKEKAKAAKKPKVAADPEYVNTTPVGQKKDMTPPMRQAYEPKVVESCWGEWWEESGYFKADANKASKLPHAEKFVLMLPPPNVTGSLHLGHALTVAIEDTLTRWHRMLGHETLWLPGTDHAGIATQSVVEKKLFKEEKNAEGGPLTRQDLGREGFLARIWDWKNKYGSTITKQLRATGCSVDWSREAFTMDAQLSAGVQEAFVRFFERGKIYRKTRLVNWSCRLKTAISDLEVEHMDIPAFHKMAVIGHNGPKHDTEGWKYEFGVITSFSYKIDGLDEEIVVATTRLETMLGDTAVAIHPEDPKYKHLHGKHVIHPFDGRKIPIILDGVLVDMNFGTGAVKITPAHDPNDYACGQRHGLEQINILAESGCMSDNCGQFAGMMRYDARIAVEKALDALGQYKGKAANPMSLGICQRSGDIIEPMLKPQWYVSCAEMAKRSTDAVRNKELEIIPAFHEATWFRWLDNIQDWCISRQLWWGHRIPAYFATSEKAAGSFNYDSKDLPAAEKQWVVERSEALARTKAAAVLGVAEEDVTLTQDEDVLDTWFSSGLFPFSTLGWPNEDVSNIDLSSFFPGHLLETGHDILFFWVARMVMMSLELTDQLPFKQVYLHAMVRDKEGRKMSKSLGNVIDPLEVVHGCTLEHLYEKLETGNLPAKEVARAKKDQQAVFPKGIPECGADALRFGLLAYTVQGRDVNLDISRVVGYRQFCNKLWQVVRGMCLPALPEGYAPGADVEASVLAGAAVRDRFILSRLNHACEAAGECLKTFKFGELTTVTYNFWIYDFCGVYLESIKPVMAGEDEAAKEVARKCLFLCVDVGLRLLHPMMPYVTEELWQRLPGHGVNCGEKDTIMLSMYPQPVAAWKDEVAERQFENVKAIFHAAMSMRASYELKPSDRPAFSLKSTVAEQQADNAAGAADMTTLAKAGSMTCVECDPADAADCAVTILSADLQLFMNVKGLIDPAAETAKLAKNVAGMEKLASALEKKRGLETYQSKTPEKVQAADKEKLEGYQAKLVEMQSKIEAFAKMM